MFAVFNEAFGFAVAMETLLPKGLTCAVRAALEFCTVLIKLVHLFTLRSRCMCEFLCFLFCAYVCIVHYLFIVISSMANTVTHD